MSDDRRDPVKKDRRIRLPRDGGRRETDTKARAELERMATLAHDQGRVQIEGVCRVALARLDELEAELLQAKAGRTLAGQNRAKALTPERRVEIATHAGKQRWLRRRAS